MAHISFIPPHSLAALPPYYQELREKERILGDDRVKELLEHQEIRNIQKTEEGYLVFTERHCLKVKIIYLPQETQICGPTRFELDIQELIPISSEN